MKKKAIILRNGFSPIIIVVIIAVVILIASAAAFYYLRSQGMLPGYEQEAANTNTQIQEQYFPTSGPIDAVSHEEDLKTLESEINATNEGSVESDIQDLDTSADSL